VSRDYDVAGSFDYQPLMINLEDLQAKALENRPDLRATKQGVTAANSQYALAKANESRISLFRAPIPTSTASALLTSL
jgi:hypothetical protein